MHLGAGDGEEWGGKKLTLMGGVPYGKWVILEVDEKTMRVIRT